MFILPLSFSSAFRLTESFKSMKIIFRFLLAALFIYCEVYGQSDGMSNRKFIFFPKEKSIGELNYFTGLSMAQLPTKIVEDVFDQVPMVELRMSYGLPYNFIARAEINSNILTNQLVISPSYSLSANRFSFNAGNEFLLWYGFFNSDGFDVSVLGWGYSPFVSAGYDFDDFYLSIKAEANIKAQNSYMKSLHYKENIPKFVGYTFTLVVEQPLWGNNNFALGFRAYYTNFFYKSWISFSTFEQYTFYPEFFAGFVF
jgi:hypothetical protein